MRTAGSVVLAALVCAASGCEKKQEGQTRRAELNKITGNSFEIIPAEGQLPFCLVFTRSETGVIRQLTMIHGNLSVRCPAGQPIGGVRYRIPVNEGAVKVHVFFSDQRLNAGSIAQEIYERKGDPSFHPMDLRLPGNVISQTFDFRPESDQASVAVGGRIGASGEIVPPEVTGADGGTEAVGGSGGARGPGGPPPPPLDPGRGAGEGGPGGTAGMGTAGAPSGPRAPTQGGTDTGGRADAGVR